ncbi:unnamed protein product [Lactuca virosa]|uniref:CASP-like protein n=1 Tax=Lactuca virosa TaxID=75947 RepID=A0AAU9PPB0_9ASTR|nr:unnamed protein product [Lactuca virosa]
MQGSMMFSRMLGSTIAFLLVVLAVSFCKCFSCLYLSRDCFKQWWILIDLLLILADCFSCSVFLVLFIHLALLTSSHDHARSSNYSLMAKCFEDVGVCRLRVNKTNITFCFKQQISCYKH